MQLGNDVQMGLHALRLRLPKVSEQEQIDMLDQVLLLNVNFGQNEWRAIVATSGVVEAVSELMAETNNPRIRTLCGTVVHFIQQIGNETSENIDWKTLLYPHNVEQGVSEIGKLSLQKVIDRQPDSIVGLIDLNMYDRAAEALDLAFPTSQSQSTLHRLTDQILKILNNILEIVQKMIGSGLEAMQKTKKLKSSAMRIWKQDPPRQIRGVIGSILLALNEDGIEPDTVSMGSQALVNQQEFEELENKLKTAEYKAHEFEVKMIEAEEKAASTEKWAKTEQRLKKESQDRLSLLEQRVNSLDMLREKEKSRADYAETMVRQLEMDKMNAMNEKDNAYQNVLKRVSSKGLVKSNSSGLIKNESTLLQKNSSQQQMVVERGFDKSSDKQSNDQNQNKSELSRANTLQRKNSQIMIQEYDQKRGQDKYMHPEHDDISRPLSRGNTMLSNKDDKSSQQDKQNPQILKSQSKQQLLKQQPSAKQLQQTNSRGQLLPQSKSTAKIIPVVGLNQRSKSEIRNASQPAQPNFILPLRVKGKTETNKFYHSGGSDEYCTIAIDPVVTSGFARFEVVFNKNGGYGFCMGIADANCTFLADNGPWEMGNESKTVRYWSYGKLEHVTNGLKGNTEFKDNMRIAAEVDMQTVPRKVVFYVNNDEQPYYVVLIPSAIRFWACLCAPSSSFTITKFTNVNQSSFRNFPGSKGFQWGNRWN